MDIIYGHFNRENDHQPVNLDGFIVTILRQTRQWIGWWLLVCKKAVLLRFETYMDCNKCKILPKSSQMRDVWIRIRSIYWCEQNGTRLKRPTGFTILPATLRIELEEKDRQLELKDQLPAVPTGFWHVLVELFLNYHGWIDAVFTCFSVQHG